MLLVTVAISVAVWTFIGIGFTSLGRVPRYETARSIMRQNSVGPIDDLTTLIVIFIAVVAYVGCQILFRNASRSYRLNVAILGSVVGMFVGSPEAWRFDILSTPMGEFVLLRTLILGVAYATASFAAFLLVDGAVSHAGSTAPVAFPSP